MKFRLGGVNHNAENVRFVRSIKARTASKSKHRARVLLPIGKRQVEKTVNVNPERFK